MNFLRKFFDMKNRDKKNERYVLKEGQNVFLKATDNVPRALAIDFVELLKKEESVEKAYLAEGFLKFGEPVHYLIGIKFDRNKNQTIENFMATISKEFTEIIPKDLYVDVIHITERDSPINNFIQDCIIPFYINSTLDILDSLRKHSATKPQPNLGKTIGDSHHGGDRHER